MNDPQCLHLALTALMESGGISKCLSTDAIFHVSFTNIYQICGLKMCVATWSVNLFRILNTEGKCSNAEAQISKIHLSMIHVE